MVRRRATGLVLVLATAASLGSAGCGSAAGSTAAVGGRADGTDRAGVADVAGEVAVFAAASLTAAYTDIGDAFEEAHPDAEVTFNFGSSSELVTQIVEGGAPADVYASADERTMRQLVDAGVHDGEPAVFATNALQIIVQPGNPLGIGGIADLGRPDLIYITCAPEVPIGRYAEQVLESAGVRVTPASFEENVKGIVTKVALGEADAGIVYRTDVLAAAADAAGVDIPADLNVVATYPVAVLRDAPNAAGARAFVDVVLSDAGRAILAAHGFGTP